MAWLELELSLGVRRMLALMLAVWTCMMAFGGFGLLIVGLILHAYISPFVVRSSSSSRSGAAGGAASMSSTLWYSYSVCTLGALMTVSYALASQVIINITNLSYNWSTRRRY